jgi:hypothetical protein
VDGDLTDWEANLTAVEDDRVSIGIQNDDEHLYFVLATSDRRTQHQVLTLGFTLWVDPEGGKKEAKGIRFPLGSGQQAGRPVPEEKDREGDPSERMNELLAENRSGFQLLAGTDTTDVTGNEAGGVRVALERTGSLLVYEVRLPFREQETGGFAIGVSPGEEFGLGLTSPEPPERPAGGRPPGGREGGFGGGGGRGGAGTGPGGGMGRPGGRQGPPEAIDEWGKVRTTG